LQRIRADADNADDDDDGGGEEIIRKKRIEGRGVGGSGWEKRGGGCFPAMANLARRRERGSGAPAGNGIAAGRLIERKSTWARDANT